jgi:hypothetical protein
VQDRIWTYDESCVWAGRTCSLPPCAAAQRKLSFMRSNDWENSALFSMSVDVMIPSKCNSNLLNSRFLFR